MERVREAVRAFPRAMLFQLYQEGHTSAFELMTSYPGIGPKCANLALGIACGQPRIGVDIHVHRITNRWGYVHTSTPEATLAALESKLPQRYWLDINALLVPFGKNICTPLSPRCSICPLVDMCEQHGVVTSRLARH